MIKQIHHHNPKVIVEVNPVYDDNILAQEVDCSIGV